MLSILASGAAFALPTFDKAFLPSSIGPGSTSTLTFTIDNSASASPATDLAFVDTLPAGITLATPASASTDCLNASINAPDGGNTLSISGGRLGGGQECRVTVNVTSSTPGVHTNISGDLTSSAGNSGLASADLTVDSARPGFTKMFFPSSVNWGGRSTLSFTIDNALSAISYDRLAFVDNLPAGLTVASPANASTTCGNPLLNATPVIATATTNTIAVTIAGASVPGYEALAAGDECTVNVDVIATGTGVLGNVSGDLTASPNFSSAGKATAALQIASDRVALSKAFTDDPAIPGETTTLRFTVFNRDQYHRATDIAFTDDLGATLTGLNATSVQGNTCDGTVLAGSNVTFSGGSLDPGASCSVLLDVAVPDTAAVGAYPNATSSLTAIVDSTPVIGSPATDTLFLAFAPSLSKEFIGDPVGAGDNVTLRFNIQNTSSTANATAITFIDELTTFLPYPLSATVPASPCGTGSSVAIIWLDSEREALSLSNGELAPSGACSFDVAIDIPTGIGGSYINTTGEITATIDSETTTGKPASDTLIVTKGVRLRKAFGDPVASGDVVTLDYLLGNDQDDTLRAFSEISFTDNLDGALTGLAAVALSSNSCGGTVDFSNPSIIDVSGAALAGGSTCNIALTLQVPAAALPGTYQSTTSEVSSVVDGITTLSVPGEDFLDISGLRLTKAFIDDPVLPGDPATLRFTLHNTTASETATGISFTDHLNATLTGLSATTPLPVTAPDCGPNSSLSGVSTLLFSNGSLNAGTSCSFDVPLVVPTNAPDGDYANTTSSLSAIIDGSPVTLAAAADSLKVDTRLLALNKSFSADTVAPGGALALSFTLTNLHPDRSVTAIEFSDDLGAVMPGLTAASVASNTCDGTITTGPTLGYSGGTLGAGASCSFSVDLQMPAVIPPGVNPFVNTTGEISGMIDGVAVTGGVANDDFLGRLLALSMEFIGDAYPGELIQLVMTIDNLDPANPVPDIAFSTDLGGILPGLAAEGLPLTGVCGANSLIQGAGTINLTGGSLEAGGRCRFAIDVRIPQDATPGEYNGRSAPMFIYGTENGAPALASITVSLHVQPIPTMHEWALLLLALLLPVLGMRYLLARQAKP
ncbi:hypothetical protein F2Q65_08705 [Thiohalocapsa marina]|uniref:Uncharacterized protein n=1 Tax=Thiohalocapsa marina TaxID=424902 RepID=A0A5M8FQ98_9GAMM|nr:hypothetical protein [Thiohalocapsa marina]KAA6185351.1 hypothetical protein F2Q65_08705 [Thiohalocapsa marina]